MLVYHGTPNDFVEIKPKKLSSEFNKAYSCFSESADIAISYSGVRGLRGCRRIFKAKNSHIEFLFAPMELYTSTAWLHSYEIDESLIIPVQYSNGIMVEGLIAENNIEHLQDHKIFQVTKDDLRCNLCYFEGFVRKFKDKVSYLGVTHADTDLHESMHDDEWHALMKLFLILGIFQKLDCIRQPYNNKNIQQYTLSLVPEIINKTKNPNFSMTKDMINVLSLCASDRFEYPEEELLLEQTYKFLLSGLVEAIYLGIAASSEMTLHSVKGDTRNDTNYFR